MFRPAPGVRVFLAPGSTDLRKQIDGLAMVAEQQLARDPYSGHLFCFCNQRHKQVKILYWDRTGFCLWQKRLSREHFHWPKSEQEVLELSDRELSWLLEGMQLPLPGGHKTRHYTVLA